jgi:hypothetical protein
MDTAIDGIGFCMIFLSPVFLRTLVKLRRPGKCRLRLVLTIRIVFK